MSKRHQQLKGYFVLKIKYTSIYSKNKQNSRLDLIVKRCIFTGALAKTKRLINIREKQRCFQKKQKNMPLIIQWYNHGD